MLPPGVLCLPGTRHDQVGDPATADFSSKEYSGALIQYPNTFGDVINPEEFVKKAHEVSVAACETRCSWVVGAGPRCCQRCGRVVAKTKGETWQPLMFC